MSVEDPFFVVKSEVEKSVENCRVMQERWRSLLTDGSLLKRDQYERMTNDLRNNVRSIEWDLEDLDETIGIVEANPRKFKITHAELKERKSFITTTRKIIHGMRDELTSPEVKAKLEDLSRKSLLRNGIHRNAGYGSHNGGGYVNQSAVDIEGDENDRFIQDTQQQQRLLIEQQDDQLDLVADSVGVLKNMSKSIGNELDEQAVMLEGLGHEMENTQSRMDTVLRKMAKVTHMSNDRRQWCAIGVLGGSMFIVFLLFFLI
ncbi:syntaxin-6-like [Styela clava]